METSKRPGVSGNSRKGKAWINQEELKIQKDFIHEGLGQNLYGRTDLTDQEVQESSSIDEEKILEALQRSPEVDISGVTVSLENGVVRFDGIAENIHEVRVMENVVRNLEGVSNVISHLELRSDEDPKERILH